MTASVLTDQESQKLQEIYADNPDCRQLLAYLGQTFQTNTRVVKVDRHYKKMGVRRSVLVRAFKALEGTGIGVYIKGAWQHPSRFEFKAGTGSAEVGQIAMGTSPEDLEDVPDPVENEDGTDINNIEAESVTDEGSTVNTYSIEQLIDALKAKKGVKSVTIQF